MFPLARLRFSLGLPALVASTALVSMPSTAHAQTKSPSAKCETTLECSSGEAALKTTSRMRLATTIDTGWIPSCPGGAVHCSKYPIQVRADLAFDAPDNAAESLYAIDMAHGAVVDATWPDKEFITLNLFSGGRTDGTFKVAHTLVPNVSLYVGPILNQEFDLNATDLLKQVPGAHFDYDAANTVKFAPWSFGGTPLEVKGPALSKSQLFSTALSDLPVIGGLVDGTLGISVATSPTFTYKTTKVTLVGADAAITRADGVAKIKSQNQDFLELVAKVEGTISFVGEMEVRPTVTLSQISSVPLPSPLTLPIGAVASKAYDSGGAPILVVFPNQTIHIPLPNVFVPTEAIDFGTVKAGTQAEKSISIGNTGELGAVLRFESSDAQFSFASASALTGPKSKHDLVVRFSPVAVGEATATITVKSNDPDAPVQTFKVNGSSSAQGGTGATSDGASNGAGDPATPSAMPGSESGCGCRVASPTRGDLAGFGLLGFAVVAFVRRRRVTHG